MSRVTFPCAVAILGLAAWTLNAQETKPAEPESPQHKILGMAEGVWDADMTLFIPGADSKPMPTTSKAVETNRMIGGKWLISDFKGEIFGMPFEGHGQNGYDAKKGKYVGTWLDSVNTHITLMEGSYDESTKTLTFNADSEEPSSGKPMKMRFETQFKADGSRLFSEYMQVEGQKEFTKLMEVKYTKRKT